MRTPESDALLAMIQQYVRGRVPPAAEDAVVEAVCHAVVAVMSEPRFYNNLQIVIDLRRQVMQAEQLIAIYQQNSRQGHPSQPSPQARKKLPTKPVKKTNKKPPLPHNVKAFKRGAAGN